MFFVAPRSSLMILSCAFISYAYGAQQPQSPSFDAFSTAFSTFHRLLPLRDDLDPACSNLSQKDLDAAEKKLIALETELQTFERSSSLTAEQKT